MVSYGGMVLALALVMASPAEGHTLAPLSLSSTSAAAVLVEELEKVSGGILSRLDH